MRDELKQICKAHPYAETAGGACPYCRLARMLRDAKHRALARPAWATQTARDNALAARLYGETLQRLGIKES